MNYRMYAAPAAACVLGLAAFSAPRAAASDYYADGSKINLCTVRGSVVTASPNADGNAPYIIHHPYGIEARWNNAYGPGWWQIQFPETFKVSSIKCGYYGETNSVMVSVGYQIQVSLDGSTWTTVATHTGGVTGMPNDGMTGYYTLDAFAAVDARYVRYAFSGHNGGEYGSPIPGSHNQMILNRVSIYGPNNPPVSTRISLAQSGWAGGSASFSDPWETRVWSGGSNSTSIADASVLVDDFYRLRVYWPNVDGNGQDTQGPPQPLAVEPSRFYVTLNDSYVIHAVAWDGLADSRRIKDIDIYTSPDASGPNWVFQMAVTNVPATTAATHYEVGFPTPTLARRVRFDARHVHNTSVHPALLIAEGYFSEFYVFGAPPPKSTVLSFEQ
jgi:hypothetical protein